MLSLILLTASVSHTDDVDFLKDVYPILESRCIECHGEKKQKADFRVDMRESLFEGDEDFVPVVPGKPEESVVIELITLEADDPDLMPNEGDPLTAEQIATIRQWIEEGAQWAEPERKPSEPDPLELPALSPEQGHKRDAASAALTERGIRPLLIAQGREALEVNASLLRDKAGDAEAALLTGLEPVLIWTNFSGTGLTDSGMQHLAGCRALRRLNVSRTAITDAGLESLSGLGELRYLNLYGTQVTDAGLAKLGSLAKLEKLFLWDTQVTPEGVAALRQTLPSVQINVGAELVPVPVSAEGPINETCPVTGKPVDPNVLSLLDDKQVAFCCHNCKGTFDKDPKAFLAKLPALSGARPINDACPVSGKPVDAAHTSTFEGALVGFCCPKCKPVFDAEPAKFAEKLGLAAAGPVNEVCPVSGQPIDAAHTLEFEGATVGFCCPKCKAAFEKEPAKFAKKIGGGK